MLTAHDDDYDDYDDEVDTGLTSRQAQKYMFDRNQSAAAGHPNHSDADEDDDADQLAAMSDEQRATLQSCIDQIRDVLGDVLTQAHMSHIVLTNAFDADLSLDAALQAAQRAQAAATAKAQRSKATPPRQQQANKADKGERGHKTMCVCGSEIRVRVDLLGVNNEFPVFSFFCISNTTTLLLLPPTLPQTTHTHLNKVRCASTNACRSGQAQSCHTDDQHKAIIIVVVALC